MVLIKISTNSQEKSKSNQCEALNEQQHNHFNHSLLPDSYITSDTLTAENFIMYEYVDYDHP